MSKSIWIDLTDFSIWTGHHTGTQRVVHQITKHLAEKPNIRYCMYDYRTLNYREVSYDDIFSIATPMGKTNPRMFRGDKFRRYYGLLTPPAVATLHSRIRNKKIKAVQNSVQVSAPFVRGDILVVLGGNWDKPYFIDALLKAKKSCGVKLFHNINDIIPIVDKGHVSSVEHTRFEEYMQSVFQNADGLFAISENTANDIVKYTKSKGIKSPRIKVIRLGDDPSEFNDSSRAPGNIPDRYILCVGTIEVRKNHQLLYYVIKEARLRGISLPKLVIAGKPGWLTGDLQYMLEHDSDARDAIIQVHSPSDSELSSLYSNCLFTVYPSYYEGWGLPVAESLLYGKTCLATSTSSVPEIAGPILEYVSPYDSGAFLEGMVRLCDDTYRKKLQSKIAKTYKPTSWSETAESVHGFLLDYFTTV